MRRVLPWLLFVGSLALAFLCYRPALQGPFLFDDILNIVENPALKIHALDIASLQAAASSMGNGIAGRPLSMASFALNYYFGGGPDAYGFKLTNLAIHLLNGVAIFILTARVLEIHRRRDRPELSPERLRWISLSVATVWLLHPLNLTGVLYVVQRMASLSALFTLLGLIAYLYGRQRQSYGKSGWGWILSAFLLFTPLAVLSKESGALLPAFMLLAEVILFNFQAATTKSRVALIGIFAVTVILPLIVLIIYSIFQPAWLLIGYNIRDFTLSERLMTEARVLWFYLRLIMVPDISQLGLHHDDIAISRGLLTPYSTLVACAGIALLAGVAVLLRKRHPIAAFGILFFLLGHSIESSVIALEIAHEHRNYLPIYGILLAAFYYLLSPASHSNGVGERVRDTLRLRQVIAVVLILFFAGVTAIRARQWVDPYGLRLSEVQHHPDSVRANTDIAYTYAVLPASSQQQLMQYRQLAIQHYQRAADLSVSDTSGLFGVIILTAKSTGPVSDNQIQELASRLEHRSFAPSAANDLTRLVTCMSSGRCALPASALDNLLSAALRNPTLYGKARSSTLMARSNFLFNVMHDSDGALKDVYAAVDAAPNEPIIRLNFIKSLLNLDKPDDAKKQISLLRERADMKIYKEQLDELEKLATMATQTSH